MNISVAIVEDNDRIREGLSTLINGSSGFKCTASFASAEDALRRLPPLKPDVVLMDIHLPGMSGIDCIAPLKQILTDTQIMMLTVFEDDDQIFRSLLAGATGYILKKTPPAELLDAIRSLHNGGSPMSDQIARRVVESFRLAGTSSRETENLTDRESEVLAYVAKGYRDKELAEKFFLSVDTVRTHLRNIYKKLHVRSRTEAVLKYLKKGPPSN
jgi:DNA-binding NarL/FixJ family response regulator